MEIKLEGAEDLQRALRALGPEATEKVSEVLGEEAESLLGFAQSSVPVASGALRDSGFADSAPARSEIAAATVGYEIPYAAAVHEGIHGGKHQKEAPPRWLEKAVDEHEETALQNVYQRLRDWVGGDGGEE